MSTTLASGCMNAVCNPRAAQASSFNGTSGLALPLACSTSRRTTLLSKLTVSASPWTAKEAGGTMSSSNGCGEPSSTRGCTSKHMNLSVRPGPHSDDTSSSTILGVQIHDLTTRHPIMSTLTNCLYPRQLNQSKQESTYTTDSTVQRTGATSIHRLLILIKVVVTWNPKLSQ